MGLDRIGDRITHGAARLLRWDFPWSPLAGFLTGVAFSLYLAALYLGVWSAKEVSLANSVELAGSYLQVLSAATLARGLGRLENELFDEPPWWRRSTGSLIDVLSETAERINEAWRSLLGTPQRVTLSPDDLKLGIESEGNVSINETVEYSSLEDRVDALEEHFRKRIDDVESQQERLKTKIEKVDSKAEDVKEDLKDEIETVWSFDLQMEVVALLWLILSPLMSAHPSSFTLLLSLSWL